MGEENKKGVKEEAIRSDEHQQSPPRPLITELTTSSFLPFVMDLEKVREGAASVSAHVVENGKTLNLKLSSLLLHC